MAFTTVVNSSFIERLLPVLRELDEDPATGPLTLALLIPSAVGDGFRSLLLASPNLDELGLLEATSLVHSKLREALGRDWLRISSVSIQRTSSLGVQALGESFDIPELGTVYKAIGSPLTGLDDPILFVSRGLARAA